MLVISFVAKSQTALSVFNGYIGDGDQGHGADFFTNGVTIDIKTNASICVYILCLFNDFFKSLPASVAVDILS